MIKIERAKKYDRYVKPKYVEDKTNSNEKWKGKPKQPNPMQLVPICDKCKNIIPKGTHECDFCGTISPNPTLIPLRTELNMGQA